MQADAWLTLASQVVVTGAAVLVVVRRPKHVVGRILVAFAVVSFLQGLADFIADPGLQAQPVSLADARLASFSEAAQRSVIGLALALLLVFPDGRLPSRRWRPAAVAIGALIPVWSVFHLLTPGALVEDPEVGVPNPFGVAVLGDAPWGELKWVFLPVAGALAVTVAMSVIVRFRSSAGDERQQLKVVGCAFLGIPLGLLALSTSAVIAPGSVAAVGTVFGMALWTVLPLSVVVAMSRYRLYDVDLLINRTVVYGLLTVILLATYAAAVLVVGRLITSWGWTAPGTVATATLAAAGLAGPGRRRIQREVDRRFARREYDAVRMVQEFTQRWRDTPAPGTELTGVLAAALQDPTLTVAYWLRERAAYADADGVAVELPGPDAGRAVSRVVHHGEPVAALIHDPLVGRRPAVLAAVGRAGLLALENTRLQAEIGVQLAEVRRSRVRIVEAADAERQRIERDLHDGAQQRLVALALRLRLAQRRPSTAPGLTVDQLADLTVDELNATVEDLRELARGIAPASLTEEGLSAALDGVAARTPIPVVLSVPAGRFPAAVERTLYYAACEAITNTVKHAGASKIGVEIRVHDDRILLTVVDDGCGGADPRRGSGLRGLADRVETVGGRVTVDSTAGFGTVLEIRMPCAF